MAKSLLGGFGPTTGPGIAEAFHPLGGFVEDVSTEVNYEIRFRSAGTLSNFLLHLETNTLNASRTWRTRKNGVNGGLSFSVAASTSGKFEDNIGSDSIAVGDDLCMQAAAAGTTGGSDIETLSFHFNATTNTVSKWIASNFNDYSAASTSYYNPVTGFLSPLLTTTSGEDAVENEIQVPGTWKGLTTVVSANARTTTTTVRSRKNSANGSQSVSISSSATGVFTDTTNTDSLTINDVINYVIVTGTGTGNIRIYTVVSEFETTNSTGCSVTGDSDALSQTVGTTRYLPPNGYTAFAALESLAKVSVQFACTWSKLFVNIAFNTRSAASTLRTRKNGVDGNQSISIPASTTGKFKDLSGTDTIAIDDDANYQSVYGTGTGSLGYGLISSYFAVGGITLVRTPAVETVTLSESTSRLTTHKRQPTESVPISEGLSRKLTARRSPTADATTLSESINRDLTLRRINIQDTIAASESVTGGLLIIRTPTADTIALSESVAAARVYLRAVEGTGRTLMQIYGLTGANANLTDYLPLAGRHPELTSTETNAQLLFKEAGVLRNLWIRLSANTINGTTTFRTRKNQIDGLMSVSIASAISGTFEDASNTDNIIPNDKVSYQRVSGGTTGSITLISISCLYNTTGLKTVQRLCSITPAGTAFSTDSVQRICPIVDRPISFAITEAVSGVTIKKAASSKNFAIFISANTRITTSTAGTRRNSVNASQSVSIGASLTGWFEDNTNSDILNVGDIFLYYIANLTGAGTLTIITIQSSLISDTRDSITALGQTAGATINANITQNYGLGGSLPLAILGESIAKTKAREKFTFSDLAINVHANTLTAASVAALRKNGVDANQSVSIPSSTTGVFTDTINTDTVSNITDEINIQVRAGATGTSIVLMQVSLSTVTPGGDQINIADSVARTLSALRNISDNVFLSESVSIGGALVRTVADSVLLSEAVDGAKKYLREPSVDSISLSESISRVYSSKRNVSDAITLSESIIRRVTMIRTFLETAIPISESLQAFKLYIGTVVDTILLSESVSRTLSLLRNIQDTITVSELVEKAKIQIRTIAADTILLSESIQRFNVIFRNTQDTIAVTEASLTRLLSPLRTLQDSIVVSEVFTGFRLVTRQVTEALIEASEFVERFTEAPRTAVDTIAVSESVSRLTSFTRNIIEPTVTLSESVIGFFRSGIRRIFFIKGGYFQSDK